MAENTIYGEKKNQTDSETTPRIAFSSRVMCLEVCQFEVIGIMTLSISFAVEVFAAMGILWHILSSTPSPLVIFFTDTHLILFFFFFFFLVF